MVFWWFEPFSLKSATSYIIDVLSRNIFQTYYLLSKNQNVASSYGQNEKLLFAPIFDIGNIESNNFKKWNMNTHTNKMYAE